MKKRRAPKHATATETSATVINLPESAIIFVEDDGTPMRTQSAPKGKLAAPVGLPLPTSWADKCTEYVNWIGEDNTVSLDQPEFNFYLRKLPIRDDSVTLCPVDSWKTPNPVTTPCIKTQPGVQYHCFMVCASIYNYDDPPASPKEAIVLAAKKLESIEHPQSATTKTAAKRIRTPMHGSIFKEGGMITNAEGILYVTWDDPATMSLKYIIQVIMSPDSVKQVF